MGIASIYLRMHVKLLDFQGGNSPFHSSRGGDFVNPQFASYFHISRFMTIERLIKPLFIFNQQYLLFGIIAEAVICSHFEQIRRLSPKSGDLTCMIYANGIMLPGWLEQWWCSGQILACGARGPGIRFSISPLRFQRFAISCFQVTIWLKYHQSDVNTQNNKPGWNIIQKIQMSLDFCMLVECDCFQRGTCHS